MDPANDEKASTDLVKMATAIRSMRSKEPKALMTMLKFHIEILKHPLRGFEVRVVDSNGCPVQAFRYPTVESARMGAKARAFDYGNWYSNCRIDDKSGVK